MHTISYPLVSSAELCVSSLQAEQLMKRIGIEGVKLTEYEMNIAVHLVDPQTMKVTAVILIHDIEVIKCRDISTLFIIALHYNLPSCRCPGEI